MSLTKKSNFIINSIEFEPKEIKLSFEGLQSSDSGRTDDGTMHIGWVKRKVRTIQITMPPMTPADATTLLSLVQGQEYSITYFDIITNAERTASVYTNKSSGDCYSGVIRNGLWQGIAFNAIEMSGE